MGNPLDGVFSGNDDKTTTETEIVAMDKTGMAWGAGLGIIWGILYWMLKWPLSGAIVKYIDKGFAFITGVSLERTLGGTIILCVVFATSGILIGGMLGSGRTRY